MRVREDDAAGAGVDADLRPECLTDEIPIWNGSELQKSQKTSHRKDMTYTSLPKTPGDWAFSTLHENTTLKVQPGDLREESRGRCQDRPRYRAHD